MAFTLYATIENSFLKLAWSDGVTRLWPYCVLLASVERQSERVRLVLSEITQRHLNTEEGAELDYAPYLGRLKSAGEELRKALFDARDNTEVAEEAQDMLRQAGDRRELSVFSEICVPWGFVWDETSGNQDTPSGTIGDFAGFWSSRFVLTLRGGQQLSRMADGPRKREGFRMLHALHKDRFNKALERLPGKQKQILEGIVDYAVGNVNSWEECKKKWSQIQENDSLLHIFGHSDGAKVYLKDASSDENYCLEADRFKSLFAKGKKTRSVTICFLNGCRTGGGPVGESFLDVLFDKGFQGFIGTEAEVSNDFAALYAAEFMDLLWNEGLSVRAAFDTLRAKLFPLSLMYSCYAHPEFCVEPARGAMTDAEHSQK
jgi:hypothetical protein